MSTAPHLPQWMLRHLPQPTEPFTISYDGNAYVVTHQGTVTGECTSLEEAYDAIDQGLSDVIFDDSLPEKAAHGLDRHVILPSADGDRGDRMLISVTSKDRVSLLEGAYERFLETAAAYREHPRDFMLAHKFVTTHPAFWLAVYTDLTPRGTTWHWETEALDLWAAPLPTSAHDDEELQENTPGLAYRWCLEAGGHIPGGDEPYTTRYHDLRLDVDAPTLEECYILLAAKLDKFLTDEGEEIPDVEYEKSPLELELDKVFRGLEAQEEEGGEQ